MTAPRLGLQLFTVRDAGDDLPAMIRRAAALGYDGVELFGGQLDGVDLDSLRATLDEHSMAVPSALAGFAPGPGFDDAELDRLVALGVATVVVPLLWVDRFADAAAVAESARLLGSAAAQAARHGLTAAYHNHHWELAPLTDGRPALVHLFEQADPALRAEVDVYWVHVAGVDVADLLSTLGDRVRLLHVKDGPGDDPTADQVAVGAGAVDLVGALAANPAVEWHHVELDQFHGDAWAAAAESARYLRVLPSNE